MGAFWPLFEIEQRVWLWGPRALVFFFVVEPLIFGPLALGRKSRHQANWILASAASQVSGACVSVPRFEVLEVAMVTE